MITCLLILAACGSNPVEGVTDSASSSGAGSTSSAASTSTGADDTAVSGSYSSSTTSAAASTGPDAGSASTGEALTSSSTSSTGSSTSTGEVDTGVSASTGALGSSTGGDPAPAACFGAPCSDEIPCGKGLVCLVHPYGGPAVCALADCIPGEYCEGDAYACSKHTPQGECIADSSGHGWCHPRACKEGWYCETGECDAGLCY